MPGLLPTFSTVRKATLCGDITGCFTEEGLRRLEASALAKEMEGLVSSVVLDGFTSSDSQISNKALAFASAWLEGLITPSIEAFVKPASSGTTIDLAVVNKGRASIDTGLNQTSTSGPGGGSSGDGER